MSARFWKGREVLKEYKLGRLVYEKQTAIPDYLCFTALESGTFTLTVPAAVTSSYLSYVEYSLDGQNWTRLTIDSTAQSITAGTAQNPIPAGGKVYWRGSGNCMTATSTAAGRQSIFSSTARFDVSGYIMSLLKGDNFASYTHLTNYNTDGVRNVTFARLFEGCTTLVDASSLVLPTFTSWHTYIFFSLFAGCTSLVETPSFPCMVMATGCYQSTFQNCSNLTTAPSLPATSLAASCYYVMFQGCSNLTEMPALPATVPFSNCYRQMFQYCTSLTTTHDISLTSMASDCCRSMFYGCTSLTYAPDLKVAVLATNCYQTMFQGCTNLKYVKCLATDISETGCLTNWLYNVSSTGTFVQAEGVTWPSGASGIPTGWVAIEKRTMPSGYKQVLYVNNTAQSGRVNTGIIVDYNSMTVELAIQQDTVTRSMPLCNASASASGNFYFYSYLDATHDLFSIAEHDGSGWKAQTVLQPLDTKPHTFKVVGGATKTYYCDGVSKGTKTYTSPSSTIDAAIFGQSGNTNTYGYVGKMYFLKIVNDTTNTTLADYVPCVRESDSVVGFWDFASGTFKESRTVNTFTAGEEI